VNGSAASSRTTHPRSTSFRWRPTTASSRSMALCIRKLAG
jgi:hypothetical protein